jgi:hypothetical protein
MSKAKRSARWILVCGLLLGSARVRADALPQIPVIFHITAPAAAPDHDAGEPPRPPPDEFIREQLEHANRIYRPLGFELIDAGHEPLPAHHARLVGRGDRDRLLHFVRRGAVHCMVVTTLMDVDEPGRERRGVHWRSRKDARHLVILSTLARPYVLAHELGHFFGNREHSETPGNLMSYDWTTDPPFLDDGQRERVQRTLQGMLGSGELRAH